MHTIMYIIIYVSRYSHYYNHNILKENRYDMCVYYIIGPYIHVT